MSGQATGWVLRHGPKERAMRMVLLTIADAANRDGEHSHPGLAAMTEGSLYGRAHVLATLRRLVDEGWLVVDEEGRGRGHATVYSIPGVVGKGPLAGPLDTDEGSNLDEEKVQSSEASPLTATVDNNTAAAPLARDHGFDKFWETYPKRNGRRVGKQSALNKWATMDLEERRACYRAAREYAGACARGETIAKDPSRFLAAGFWKDWLVPLDPEDQMAASTPQRPPHVPSSAVWDPTTGTWVG